MRFAFQQMKNFHANQNGATSIEYGLMAVIAAVALTAGAEYIGNYLTTGFDDVAQKVNPTESISQNSTQLDQSQQSGDAANATTEVDQWKIRD